MDKYEYNLKLDEIRNLYADGKYEAASKIADGINWNKEKNVNTLVKVGDIYEKLGRLKDSKEILVLAYNRSPLGRMIIYKLAKLALRLEDFDAACEYYDQFVEIAPNDNLKYILRYEIKKAKGASVEELIPILECYKEQEYTEEWAYELAYLYHKAGMIQKCVAACDELVLWFGEGPYVERALELKIMYHPLTKKQEEKYKKFHLERDDIEEIEELVSKEEKVKNESEPQSAEKETTYDTNALKEKIEESIKNIKEAKDREAVSANLKEIQKLVENIPYLKFIQVDEDSQENKKYIETDEEIDGSLKVNFKELLDEEDDGQLSLLTEKETDDENIEGQMSIEDVLGEWEKTKRAAEAALEDASKRKLKSSKARALNKAEDVLGRLNAIIPKLEEGYSPKELLEREYLQDDYKLVQAARQHNLGVELDPDKIKAAQEEKENEKVQEALKAERKAAGIYKADDVTDQKKAQILEEAKEASENVEEIDVAEFVDENDVEQTDENESEWDISDESDKTQDSDENSIEETDESNNTKDSEKEEIEDKVETVEKDEEAQDDSKVAKTQETDELSEANDKVESETEAESKNVSTDNEPEKEDKESLVKDSDAKNTVETAEEDKTSEDVQEEENDESDKDEESPKENSVNEEQTIGEEAWNGLKSMFDSVFGDTPNKDGETAAEIIGRNDEIADKTGVLVDFDAPKGSPMSVESQVTKPLPSKAELQKEKLKKAKANNKAKSRDKKKKVVVKELTREQKAIFSYFVPIDGMEEQLCSTLTGLSNRLNATTSANTGNLIVQGDRGCGKTVLATGIIKVLQEETGKPKGRVGKIQSSALNKKDINKLIRKVSGGCLIIENVSELTKNTAVALSLLMEHDKSGMLIVFEDTPEGIEKAFTLEPALEKKFSQKVEVPMFTTDNLVSFGKAYSTELGYALDEMAILALYNRISNIQRLDQATTISQVKEIIDEAIENEQRGGIKKAISNFRTKRYTDDNRIILRERDFE